jgi:hypothetical protein
VLRQYRRYRAGKTTKFFVFEIEEWVRRRLLRFDGLRWRWGDAAGVEVVEVKTKNMPDAELDTEGPLPELGGRQPFGTMENPAELSTVERFSWRSRVSRMFIVHSRRGTLMPGN